MATKEQGKPEEGKKETTIPVEKTSEISDTAPNIQKINVKEIPNAQSDNTFTPTVVKPIEIKDINGMDIKRNPIDRDFEENGDDLKIKKIHKDTRSFSNIAFNQFPISLWLADDKFIPTRATTGSAAYDLKFNLESFNAENASNCYRRGNTIVINPNGRGVFPCGFRMAIPNTVVADVRGRSGLAVREGLGLTNGIGTIDSDYRGEVGAILHNYSDSPIIIHADERIAQMVFLPVLSFIESSYTKDLKEFLDNNSTDRNEGGFGHTGK